MGEPLLTRRAVLLAKIEGTYNVDASPTQTADAILVEAPEFSIDPQILERNFVRDDLDRLPHRVGRKLAMIKFSHEVRSNGVTQSGSSSDACKFGRLLRGCGFAQTAIAGTTGTQVGAINAGEANVSAPTWAAGGTWTGLTQPMKVRILVTTGGASGAAQVSITPDAQSLDAAVTAAQTAVTVTSATLLNLKSGGTGATVTPTFTGSLTIGDYWDVWVWPVGFLYKPVSTGFESLTLYLYLDGVLHALTGGRGTFSLSGEAGNYAKADFTFTGQYVPVTDAAIPTAGKFERQLPAIVELADLWAGAYKTVCANFSADLGNTITPRMDANHSDGYNGVRITGRDVKGSMDPEMDLVANNDFWGQAATGTTFLFRVKIGQSAGNRIWMLGSNCQYSAPSYKDRDDIRALDMPINFNRDYGDDGLMFVIS